jgi:hypothetical protein
LEEIMPQDNAQRLDESTGEPQESFSNKPAVLADTGHGTKVKLWTNKNRTDGTEFQTVSIERSFKRQGSEQWETQKVNLNADDLLAVARGLQKGHDTNVGKMANHADTRTTQLYDRRGDSASLDEYGKVGI